MSRKTIITISGYPGSGTTTLASALAETKNTTYVNGGDIFRAMAKEKNMSVTEFGKYVNSHPEIDKQIDTQLRKVVTEFLGINEANDIPNKTGTTIEYDSDKERLILESRLAGWIAGNNASLRFWIHAPITVRASRRKNETIAQLQTRQEDEINRYKKWYNIDVTDHSIYDYTLNTAKWQQQHLVHFIQEAVNLYDPEKIEGEYTIETPFSERI